MVLQRHMLKQKTESVRQAEHKSTQARLPAGLNEVLPVDVGGNGLVRRLVHAADGQPHKALLPFNEPAVRSHHGQLHQRQQDQPKED